MTTQNNRNRWILIGALIVLVVAIFGLFVFSRAATVWNTIISRTDQPVSVAAHYYEAIRNQDYAAAYADLDSRAALNGQPIDKQAFINLAKAADTQRGGLLTYGLLRQPGDGTQFNASLRRGDQAYTVHLQLQQEGNIWKIMSVDGLQVRGLEAAMLSHFMRAPGMTRAFHADVTEPEPGRVLVESNWSETDPASKSVTTFTVDPVKGKQQTQVTISTALSVSSWPEGLFTTMFLRRVYAQELKQIASLAQERLADSSTQSVRA